jgi:hypothetical protein
MGRAAEEAATVSLPSLLTVNETARLFRTSSWSVRRWSRNPHHPLQAVKVGNRLLFVQADVEQLIADRRGAPKGAA